MIDHDPQRFVSYYENQAGGSLPGFYGAPVMYGRGIGSIFSRLFRFVAPLVRKGFAIAKPHLKSAAKNIASDVIGKAVRKFGRQSDPESQEGSGGLMVFARRARKRPPGKRIPRGVKKVKHSVKRKSLGKKHPRRRNVLGGDIF